MFTDLRGYAADPRADPAVVLGAFLLALGAIPSEIPSDIDGRAALFRTLLEGTRTFVVLDNASDAEQVRPPLPGSPTSLALITSRLSSAVVREGAVRITAHPMTANEAHQLLRSVAGPRLDTDPAVAQVVAERAGRLPLALRIAAERASVWSNKPLRALADELTRRQPLDVLAVDDSAVRTVCRSKSHRCWSSGMSVLIDESAEDVGAEQCAGTEVVYCGWCCWVSEYRYAA